MKIRTTLAPALALGLALLLGACAYTETAAPPSTTGDGSNTARLKPAEATTMSPKYGPDDDAELPPYRMRLRTKRGERVTEF